MSTSLCYHDLTQEAACGTPTVTFGGDFGGALTVQSGSSTQSLFTNDLSDSCWFAFTSTNSLSRAWIDVSLTASSPHLIGAVGLLGMSLRVTSTVTPKFQAQIFNGASVVWDNDFVPETGSGLDGFADIWQDCGDKAVQQWIRRTFKYDYNTSGTSTWAGTKVRFMISGLPNGHVFEIGKCWISRALTFRHGQALEPDSMGYDDPSLVTVTDGGQVQCVTRALRRAQNITLAGLYEDEVAVSGGRLDYLDRVLAHSGKTKPIIYMPSDRANLTRSYQRAVYGYLQSLRYGPVSLGRVGADRLYPSDAPSTQMQIFSFRSQVLEAR